MKNRLALRLAVTLAGMMALNPSARGQVLPAGFSDSLVTAVSSPTATAFTPDGRMLFTS